MKKSRNTLAVIKTIYILAFIALFIASICVTPTKQLWLVLGIEAISFFAATICMTILDKALSRIDALQKTICNKTDITNDEIAKSENILNGDAKTNTPIEKKRD